MKRLYWVSTIVVVAGLAVLWSPQATKAQQAAELNIKRTITVGVDDGAEVGLMISGSGAQQVDILLPGRDVEQVKVQINGASSPELLATGVTRQIGQVAVELSQVTLDTSSAGDNWQAEISYTTNDLVSTYGDYSLLAIPDDANSGTAVTTDLLIDVERGFPAILGIEPDESYVSNAQQVYEFSDNTQSIVLSFGSRVNYDGTLSAPLVNGSWWWKTVDIVLPPDTNQQTVSLTSLSPRPKSVRVDTDGNIIASYRLRPRQSINVEASFSASSSSLKYDIAEVSVDGLASEGLQDYLAAIGPWSGGSQLAGANLGEILANVTNSVAAQDYEEAGFSAERANAVAADLRATGIPVRVMYGQLLFNGAQSINASHVWFEIYAGAEGGWVTFDPVVAALYPQMTATDPLRITTTIRGINPDVPPVTTPESLTITAAADELEIIAATPQVQQTKFIILPGLAFTKTSVTTGSGAIVDNIVLTEADGVGRRLGSLAPLQTVTLSDFDFGPASWSQTNLAVGTGSDQSIEQELGTASSTVSYVGAGLAVLVVAGGAGLTYVLRKRGKGDIDLNERDEDIGVAAEDLLSQPTEDEDYN